MTTLTLLPRAGAPKNDDMLSALDDLRARIVAGEIIAFAAVGIKPDDEVAAWCGAVPKVSRLRVTGAISVLLNAHMAGDF